MDIQHLRCFVAVAESLHFAKAAERLHLTPSPVSRTIKELERELKTDLFVRRYHAVELTETGAALVDPARDLLIRFDELKDLARATAGDALRMLHIGGTHHSPPSVFDAVINVVDEGFPDVEFDVELASSAELLPSLEREELDLAMVHLPFDNLGLDSLTVAIYSFSVAMRADDELADRDSVSLADLCNRTIIMSSPKLQPVAMGRVRSYLEDAGVRSFHEMLDTNPVLAASHVRRSRELSLTVMSGEGASQVYDDSTFAVVPINDPGLRLCLGVAWRRRAAEHDQTLAAVIAALRVRFEATPMLF